MTPRTPARFLGIRKAFVITDPLLRVGEYDMRLTHIHEPLRSLRGIARAQLIYQLLVSLFDLLLRGRVAHTQNLVIIALCLCCQDTFKKMIISFLPPSPWPDEATGL